MNCKHGNHLPSTCKHVHSEKLRKSFIPLHDVTIVHCHYPSTSDLIQRWFSHGICRIIPFSKCFVGKNDPLLKSSKWVIVKIGDFNLHNYNLYKLTISRQIFTSFFHRLFFFHKWRGSRGSPGMSWCGRCSLLPPSWHIPSSMLCHFCALEGKSHSRDNWPIRSTVQWFLGRIDDIKSAPRFSKRDSLLSTRWSSWIAHAMHSKLKSQCWISLCGTKVLGSLRLCLFEDLGGNHNFDLSSSLSLTQLP